LNPLSKPRPLGTAGAYSDPDADRRAVERFTRIRDRLLCFLPPMDGPRVLNVADIGCGNGAQIEIWAARGHIVHGLDVDADCVEAAGERAASRGLSFDLRVGFAESLPWPDELMDICLAVEVLEHVDHWERCLDELVRILKPRGLLYLSTTNRLCPKQQEFDLPLYSWYPAVLKRRYERLARSSHLHLAQDTKYPAVNWFTPYQLRAALRQRGLEARDRFDMIALGAAGPSTKIAVELVRRFRLARLLAHVVTPCTTMLARKE